ncbi:MAG: transposase zinc-binding domain-containing protein [Segetibacter sp.]
MELCSTSIIAAAIAIVPQCGNSKKEEWIEARMKELLPVKYYHAVFTDSSSA